MKWIITDFFEKQFKKVVTDMTLDNLITKIHTNSKNFIQFKDPYIKVKVRSLTKSYRLILVFDPKDANILLINIFDKKDKKYGENISWDLHKSEILLWTAKNKDCLQDKKYRTKSS